MRIVVPQLPGGGADTICRLIANELTVALKQPVVIENRPGGGTTIGASVVAQAPPDGHSLVHQRVKFSHQYASSVEAAYDPHKDFAPLTLAASNPHVLVISNSLGARTMRDFITTAKAKGKALSYASFGNGSSGHLAFELLKKTYGFEMEHVPYKGTPQAMLDVIAGRVQAMLTDMPAAIPQAKSGKMVVLAIAADKRSPTMPEVPTFQEATGTRFLSRSWWGFLVHSGTPREIQKVLYTELVRALQKPEVKGKLHDIGIDAIGSTTEEFVAFMKTESDRFAEAIRFSGMRAQ